MYEMEYIAHNVRLKLKDKRYVFLSDIKFGPYNLALSELQTEPKICVYDFCPKCFTGNFVAFEINSDNWVISCEECGSKTMVLSPHKEQMILDNYPIKQITNMEEFHGCYAVAANIAITLLYRTLVKTGKKRDANQRLVTWSRKHNKMFRTTIGRNMATSVKTIKHLDMVMKKVSKGNRPDYTFKQTILKPATYEPAIANISIGDIAIYEEANTPFLMVRTPSLPIALPLSLVSPEMLAHIKSIKKYEIKEPTEIGKLEHKIFEPVVLLNKKNSHQGTCNGCGAYILQSDIVDNACPLCRSEVFIGDKEEILSKKELS